MTGNHEHRGVIVIGAGEHALVSIEVLVAAGHRVRGCVSIDGTMSADLGALGVVMLGAVRDLAELLVDDAGVVFVAVGSNTARRDCATRALAGGATLATAISPTAIVSPTAVIEAGALVMPGAVVNALARIGTGAIINTRASVDHECSIGAFAHIGPGATLAGRVTVGDGAFVGAGATVVPGRTIGERATVGAGAVVIHDVPETVVVAGVPARPDFAARSQL